MEQKRMTEHEIKWKNAILHLYKLLAVGIGLVGFGATWAFFYADMIRMPFFYVGNYVVCGLYAALYLMTTKLYGGFQVGMSKASELIYSQIISLVICNGLMYCIICLLSYRLANILPLFLNIVFSVVFEGIWCWYGNRLSNFLFPAKQTVIVYDYLQEEQLIHEINRMSWRFKIVGMVNLQDGLETVLESIKNAEAVFISGVSSSNRNIILKYCIEHGIQTYVRPKIGDLIVSSSKRIQLNGIPVLYCSRNQTSLWYSAFKRGMDIMIATLGLIVASPFMLITALLIKLYDGGPIIYKQCRLTKDGKQFYIMKFRSMRVDAEKDGVARLASQNDDRITPIGKFIRAVRFDELPQIINILKGDMSIVGPRPERPEIAEQYAKEMPEFNLRLQVKAGLTGYAQVYGKYNSKPYDKLEMDLIYIANQSIVQDVKLMFATIKILFMSESTEGIQEGQVTAHK